MYCFFIPTTYIAYMRYRFNSVTVGAKLTGSAGLPLIVLIANARLREEGGCSVIPSDSLP